jgi:hypothetical protein
MNTGHALTTTEWITKLQRDQIHYAEENLWIKVRSIQLKIDNALGVINRGKIGNLISKYLVKEELPNRAARRIADRERRKTAEGKVSETNQASQRHANNPTAAIDEKELGSIRAAKGRLYDSLKNSMDSHLVWGSTVSDDDSIVIFSTEAIKGVPEKFEGYVVTNKVAVKPDEASNIVSRRR